MQQKGKTMRSVHSIARHLVEPLKGIDEEKWLYPTISRAIRHSLQHLWTGRVHRDGKDITVCAKVLDELQRDVARAHADMLVEVGGIGIEDDAGNSADVACAPSPEQITEQILSVLSVEDAADRTLTWLVNAYC